jgi:mannose-6-phosphate isomerase-like protein (cupin superfamily)
MIAMRCVVTGQEHDGKSVIVTDEQVEPITVSLLPGLAFHRLWGADSPPTLPATGEALDQSDFFPPPGGYRFGFFTLGPESVTLPEDLDFDAAFAELRAKLPGLAEAMEPDRPGMHTTDTVDLDLVISGQVWLELDDGVEVHLHAGDAVVQNGTRHAWHNRGSEPAVLFTTLLGARRTPR